MLLDITEDSDDEFKKKILDGILYLNESNILVEEMQTISERELSKRGSFLIWIERSLDRYNRIVREIEIEKILGEIDE
jgi:hypothetical protein